MLVDLREKVQNSAGWPSQGSSPSSGYSSYTSTPVGGNLSLVGLDYTNVVDGKKKVLFEADEKTFFKDTFLDSEYSIRQDIHERFKRFSWLRGAYGVTGPNKRVPRLHIYVTVKSGKRTSQVYHEIKQEFKCDPKKFFELFRYF